MKYDNVYKVGLATVNRRNIRISNTKKCYLVSWPFICKSDVLVILLKCRYKCGISTGQNIKLSQIIVKTPLPIL